MMKYRVFNYSIPCEGELRELNGFLSSHRILKVREDIVQSANSVMLVFVVNYLDGTPGNALKRGEPRIDYKKELSEEDFAVFSRLRDVRKELAEKEGIPVYSVFTNAQLAEMVKERVKAKSDLSKISGIGQARVDKYGDAVLSVCRDLFTASGSE